MHKSTYKDIIRKKMNIIFSFLVIITLSLTTIILLMNYNNKSQNILIEVFGRQRMLTQMIAKDANQKYELLHYMSLNQSIDSLNQSMKQSKNDFETTLSSLETGVIIYDDETILHFKRSLKDFTPLIEDTFLEWNKFKSKVNIIINNNEINDEFISALDYINEHNLMLLKNSDEITHALVEEQNQQINQYMIVVLIGFILCVIFLVIIILQLQKYIISPLNELYNSISDLGFLNKNQRPTLPTKKQIIPVVEDINKGFNKLKNLIELIQKINEETSFDGTLNYIYHSFSQFIPYSHIGIALLRDNGKTLEASYGISDPAIKAKISKLSGLKADLNNTSLGSIIHDGTIRVINDLDQYDYNKNNRYNQILINSGIKSSITIPLNINNKPVGVIFFSSIHKNIYTKEHISFLETLSSSIAISFNKNIFIDELIFSSILALAKMAESRDEETGDHLDRMKLYSVKITECLQKDELFNDQIDLEFIKNIEKFSPMHDIGKVGVRDGILLKPGKLTIEEFEEMKKHTVYGAEVLKAAENNMAKSNKSLFKFGIDIVESHHERWDGTGYPNHKSGSEIPLSARIVSVADVLDALTSKRPYKKAFTFEESFDMIVSGRGKHFDPVIVDSIIRHKDEIYELYQEFNEGR